MDTLSMKYVGRFTEADIIAKRDKIAIAKSKEILPAFRYIYSKYVKKGHKIVALDVWLSREYV